MDNSYDKLVSVIVPIYNGESYLKECLESLKILDKDLVEVLLINDGSTDMTEEIIKDGVSDEINFRYVKKENSGVSATRNAGIELASGKYLAFVDCDDIVLPYFSIAMNALLDINRGGYDFYLFSIRIGECVENSTIGDYRLTEGENSIENLYKIFDTGGWGPWAKFYKKEIVERYQIRFNVGLKICEDQLFNLDYWNHIKTIYYGKTPIYLYRTNHDSVVNKPNISQLMDIIYISKRYRTLGKFENDVLCKIMTRCLTNIVRIIAKNYKYGNEFACKEFLAKYGDEIHKIENESNINYLSKLNKLRYYLFKYKMYWMLSKTVR